MRPFFVIAHRMCGEYPGSLSRTSSWSRSGEPRTLTSWGWGSGRDVPVCAPGPASQTGPQLEVDGCKPHRAMRQLREPFSGGASAAGAVQVALPPARQVVQLLVPVSLSSLFMSRGRDSSFTNMVTTWKLG